MTLLSLFHFPLASFKKIISLSATAQSLSGTCFFFDTISISTFAEVNLCCLESGYFAGSRLKRKRKKVGKPLFKQCVVFNEAFPALKDVTPWVNYKTNIKFEFLSEVYFCLPDISPILTPLSHLCQAVADDKPFVLISQ